MPRECAGAAPGGFQLEPASLVRSFLQYPPAGFDAIVTRAGAAAFVADFDLLTTMSPRVRKWLAHWPLPRRWHTLRTTFIGTTVTEYAQIPLHLDAAAVVDDLRGLCQVNPLLIVKDLPVASPLLDEAANRHAAAVLGACRKAGFTLVAGQALAYVPIDFSHMNQYLAARSAGRRKDLRRKLRSLEMLETEVISTGDRLFDDAQVLQELYGLYLAVHAQSQIHFDLLQPEFFQAVFTDASSGGLVFLYRHRGELAGFNLCFVRGDKLIDKYIGLRYPLARELNLYVVSWFKNLEYAMTAGLKYYVAGWTDPQVKKDLGASFTWTEHAVLVRNPLLRAALKAFQGLFESDAVWHRKHDRAPSAGS